MEGENELGRLLSNDYLITDIGAEPGSLVYVVINSQRSKIKALIKISCRSIEVSVKYL